MLSQVRCLAFDAVGTLIFPDPPVAEVYARVGRRFGASLSEAEARARFHLAFRAEYETSRPTSEIEERNKWRRIVQQVIGLEDIEACFEELFAHFGRAASWRCFPDVADTLRELSRRGFDLVLASNFDRRLHAICEGHAELEWFSSRVISSEVGVFKPHSEFYQALLERTGFEKHEVLMVGDDWSNDVRGALEFGLPAVYLDRSRTGADAWKDNVRVISSLTKLPGLLP